MTVPAELEDKRQRYDRAGLLALDPKAFFFMFGPPEKSEPFETFGSVAVVSISGPLDHHAGWWCDSYDEIRDRVLAACESSCETIVLKLDSPGGQVSGCFETARALRALIEGAEKRSIAYADGQACSGAYALALAATEIVVPETGFVGSIGVINTSVEVSALHEKHGINVTVTSSGKRKADGHFAVPMTSDTKRAIQAQVDSLAEVFFELVAELRPTLDTRSVRALEAGIFHGKTAVEKKLADRVLGFDELLAQLNSDPGDHAMTTQSMQASLATARSALEETAKGTGPEAKKARRALAAMSEGEEEKAEGEDAPAEEKPEEDAEGEEAPAEEEGEAEGEAEGEETPAEEKKPEGEASARARGARGAGQGVSTRTAADLAGTVSQQGKAISGIQKQLEASERSRFLATRPDLDKSLLKVLAGKPLVEVREIVNAIPKPKVPKAAAAAQARGTSGAGQGGIDSSSSPAIDPIDEAMGLVKKTTTVTNHGTRQVLGAFVPVAKT